MAGGKDDPGNGASGESSGAEDPVEPAEALEALDAPEDPEAIWRSIIENYGDRVLLDGAAADSGGESDGWPDDESHGGSEPEAQPEPEADLGRLRRLFEPLGPAPGAERAAEPGVASDSDLAKGPDAPFVPPPTPPLPTPTGPRRAAWIGLFGAPPVLLICLVLQVALPRLVSFALAASFVAGFVYLVATMNPRDPDDDGARL